MKSACKPFQYLRGGHITTLESHQDELVFPPDFISNQEQSRIRIIVLDWLISVMTSWKFRPNTVHMTIQLVDRYYLGHEQVLPKEIAQKVGCVCLWIAAKFHEVHQVTSGDLDWVTRNMFASGELVRMEIEMLVSLEFKLWYPTYYDVWLELWDHTKEPFSKERIEMMNFILETAALFPINHGLNQQDLVQAAMDLSFFLTASSSKETRMENPIFNQLMQQVKKITKSSLTAIKKKYQSCKIPSC